MRRAYLALVWLWLLVLAAPAWALDLDQHDSLMLNQGEMGWLADPAGTLTLEQVRARDSDFLPVINNFSKGFTRQVFWLRLPVHRQVAPADWWLDIRPASLDELSLYTVGPDGRVSRHESGDHVPMRQRDAEYSNYLFRLDVPEGDSTYYLRVRTNSAMMVIARLQRADVFPVEATVQYLQAGLYIGVIITVLILSTVYLAIWRRRLYVIYVVYLLAQLTLIFSGNGLMSQYLFPGLAHVSQRMSGFALSAAIGCGLLFFSGLLSAKPLMRGAWTWRLFQGIVLVVFLTAVAALAGHYGQLAPWMLLALPLAIALMVPALLRSLRRGTPEERIFALSFVLFVFYVSGSALRSNGLMPITEFGIVTARAANIAHLMLLQVSVMLRSRTAEREAMLVRQEALQRQRIVAEQEQFLAMITHEIRTPLSVINAASESLRMIDPDAALPDRSQRYDRIAHAIRRVDQLLDLPAHDRLNASERDRHVQVDVVAMTRELLAQMMDEQLGRAQLRVSWQEAWVEANPALLQFSLLNLVDNASKYSPADKPIQLDIVVTPAERMVRWVIQDQGPGVCADDHERIFEKYYRSAEQSGKPGLGLGLYLARGLVQRLGGQLIYYDRLGGGAVFEIRLPLAETQHA
jgi:signal transduction histidine kinase